MSRSVLITGCSSGIGLAAARTFHQAGWRVIATARRPETLEQLDTAARLKLDVTNSADRDAVAAHIASHFDARLDALVNNAGASLIAPFEEAPEASIRRVLEVNFFGVIGVTRALLPALRAAGGRVINVSSMITYFPLPMNSFYIASKSALESLSAALANEMAPHGVAVSALQPGPTKTQFAANMELYPAATDGPYVQQMEDFLTARRRLIARGGEDASTPAQAILALAQNSRPPIAARVGAVAKGAWVLSRVLPSALYSAIVRRSVRPRREDRS